MSLGISSQGRIMEQVLLHTNGLMAQWHSPLYVRFSSRVQVEPPYLLAEKENGGLEI